MQLHEKHRPTAWAEVIGQDKVLVKIDRLRKRGLAGRTYWLSGQSGTGKTTIARLIAAEVADDWVVDEIDGSKCTPSKVDEIEESLRCRPLGGKCWVWIINEAHLLTPRVIGRLLVTVENLPSYGVMILTTTCEAQEQLFDARLDGFPQSVRHSQLGPSRLGQGLCRTGQDDRRAGRLGRQTTGSLRQVGPEAPQQS